jgi:hypothetical protein
VEEGVINDDFGGRQWNAQVMTLAEAKQQKKQIAESQKKEKKEQNDVSEGREILKYLCKHQGEYSVRKTLNDLGWNKTKFRRVLNLLEGYGWIELKEGSSTGGHGASQNAQIAKITSAGYEGLK